MIVTVLGLGHHFHIPVLLGRGSPKMINTWTRDDKHPQTIFIYQHLQVWVPYMVPFQGVNSSSLRVELAPLFFRSRYVWYVNLWSRDKLACRKCPNLHISSSWKVLQVGIHRHTVDAPPRMYETLYMNVYNGILTYRTYQLVQDFWTMNSILSWWARGVLHHRNETHSRFRETILSFNHSQFWWARIPNNISKVFT